ncbi:hypothetical protein G7075_05340 [Phycicoccus sp. HDW14]|uniref:hypothetical protein n=1 Tax=Phycicoccus sp. HDW14 TaxID=2714941 RepID=UPI00140A4F3F|nr:hypothetical protein [Phycicoccus sp. HDW14]QIM20707.1 hypothetical protein G7075_05340 [Phycicoccus sp. HDW14]
MTAEGWHEQVGSVAEEAERLLASLRRSGEGQAREDHGTREDHESRDGHGTREGHEPHGTPPAGEEAPRTAGGFSCDDPVCQWCPVCRTSAFVRQLSPETLSGLAELAGFAASVLGDLAASRSRQDRPREDDDA